MEKAVAGHIERIKHCPTTFVIRYSPQDRESRGEIDTFVFGNARLAGMNIVERIMNRANGIFV